ncbi:MAG: UDP-N-acetylmuramoyl-tripeptide--D-alanyl-D-alanine ligase [Clostridia bacterium]|nr:UDP-N-acetylmuramoyl-tripeptide--D-alanyl-D-alanine ligase [Clostridia bacterium]
MLLQEWIFLLALAFSETLASWHLMHLYQLESYQLPGYFRSLRRAVPGIFLPPAVMAALSLIVCLSFRSALPAFVQIILAVLLLPLAGWYFFSATRKQKAKKKFGITPRVKRLIGMTGAVYFLLQMLSRLILGPGTSAIISCVLQVLLMPLCFAVCCLCALPVEKTINRLYFRDAQKCLKEREDIIRIGITGSYGKTSVKFILGTLLSEKYQTLVTPSSFNTPMGLTKVIRTQLHPAHQVFVAEMGARHVGDIRELCELVHPTIGILTSVGPQHLETFHTLERIRDTKYELMEAIPQNGACYFADDGDIVRGLYQKTEKQKTLTGLERNADTKLWAEDIETGSFGSRFTLCRKQDSGNAGIERIPCETKMLGEHNIQNILLASAVALDLGLSMKQLQRGIARLRSVEHRLQLVDRGGIHVIDDAFNSNPQGAKLAMKVLSQFPQKRIVVTPGMVELGAKEEEENRKLGAVMAECCDAAILVGKKHTQPIHEGLTGAGFPEHEIYVVDSLQEATGLLGTMTKPGDTVLFENDLPDNYA